ncbi:MAG: hypothetical protein J5903_01385, partial [Clostridia bacterium]|nr:hypothetical protein [Clostridia bacterium]
GEEIVAVSIAGGAECEDFYFEGGCVYIRRSGFSDVHGDTAIIFCSEDKVYKAKCKVFDALISKAESFASMLADTVHGGYYGLYNDLDMSGTEANFKLNLKGVFDGNGYTINGLKCAVAANSSLFGGVSDCLIKNVAFTNIAMTSSSTGGNGFFFDSVKGNAVFDNVYISIKTHTVQAYCGVIARVNTAKVTLNNCVIEYKAFNKNNKYAGLLFAIGQPDADLEMNESYIISASGKIVGDIEGDWWATYKDKINAQFADRVYTRADFDALENKGEGFNSFWNEDYGFASSEKFD